MHNNADFREGVCLLEQNQSLPQGDVCLMILNNFERIVWPCADDVSFKCLPYQLVGCLMDNQGGNG